MRTATKSGNNMRLWGNFTKEEPEASGTNFLSIFTNICEILVVEQTKDDRPAFTHKMCGSPLNTLIQKMTPPAASSKMAGCTSGEVGGTNLRRKQNASRNC